MKELEFKVSYRILKKSDLSDQYQSLIVAAKMQCNNAYAPYSDFRVGAAVLLDNGQIVGGSNQENAAYPSGLCAERVAIFAANSQFPNSSIMAIALTAYNKGAFIVNPISPCGACRQVLLEAESRFNQEMDILFFGENDVYFVKGTAQLLPFAFNKTSLD